VAALAALPAACASIPPAGRSALPPVPAAATPPVDPQVVLGVAQLAGTLELPFAPAFMEHLVGWQRTMSTFFHGAEDRFVALADDAGIVIPDLTVLSIEPVAHAESSGFGWRDDPIRHTRRFHAGTDFRGKAGTPVLAAGNGVVVFCGRLGGYGNAVDIDHGGGVVTRYAHLRRIDTKKGAAITAGDAIGQVGATGRATGPHLHFEVRLDGAPVSPIAAMSVAALQRESPLAGRLAALSLSPELQAAAESEVDPPKQRARPGQRPAQRPERPGRPKRRQILW
jgi:murein DD-endopeptidase MepM/ murein hydrolase activator NlpD